MNHLTVDEIIAFVSITELNEETMTLLTSVNGHIRTCEKCRKLVNAFQLLYDTFTNQCCSGSFSQYARRALESEQQLTKELEQYH